MTSRGSYRGHPGQQQSVVRRRARPRYRFIRPRRSQSTILLVVCRTFTHVCKRSDPGEVSRFYGDTVITRLLEWEGYVSAPALPPLYPSRCGIGSSSRLSTGKVHISNFRTMSPPYSLKDRSITQPTTARLHRRYSTLAAYDGTFSSALCTSS